MSETRIVAGADLAPPPQVPPEGLELYDSVIAAVQAGTPASPAWSNEAKLAFDQARFNFEQCQKRGDNFALVLERVHEMGAAGPGRSLRLKASWIERKDNGPRTTYAYPRGLKLEEIIYTVRNILEHCFRT
jgi:hypothetical protein